MDYRLICSLPLLVFSSPPLTFEFKLDLLLPLLSFHVYTSSRFSCHWMALQFSYNHPVLQFICLCLHSLWSDRRNPVSPGRLTEKRNTVTFMGMQIHSWMSILSDSLFSLLFFLLLHSFSLRESLMPLPVSFLPYIFLIPILMCFPSQEPKRESLSRQWLKVLLFFDEEETVLFPNIDSFPLWCK